MGYPVVNGISAMLAIYQALDSRRSADRNTSRIQRAVESFSLLAFVLHDPREHRQFDRCLTSQFVELDRKTGEDLLFFAVVELEVPDYMARRRYMRVSRAWLDAIEKGFLQYAPWRWDDSSLALEVLCGELGISLGDLPCIVVTKSARSSKAFLVKTSVDLLANQLDVLGKLASELGDERLESSPRTTATKLTPVRFIDAGIAEEHLSFLPLQKRMANVFAETIGFCQSDERGAPSAERTIAERRGHLALVREMSTQQPWRIEEAEEALARAFLWTSSKYVNDELYAVDGLEDETSRFLRNALKLLAFSEDPDFSPHMSVGQLGLGFEYEVNLSLAQWIRKKYGIELPAFFCRPQPGGDVLAKAAASRGGYPVNVNESRKGRWIAPGLGQCLHLSERFLDNGWPSEWSDGEEWSEFLRIWADLVKLRNRHAHAPDFFEEAPASGRPHEQAHELWKTLMLRKHLERMVRLKLASGRAMLDPLYRNIQARNP